MPQSRWRSGGWRAPGAMLISGSHAALLQANQFSMLQNCWQRFGKIVKRGGTAIQGSALSAATCRWLQHAYSANSSTALALRLGLSGTLIRYKVGAGGWTTVTSGLTAGTFPISVTYKDIVWWCDGTNSARQLTIANPPVDSAWGGLPSGINPSWVVLHKNRLYYGGDLSSPTYVYMTNPGTPTTTTTTDFYQIPDDQRGFYPKIAVDMGEGIGFFAQDYKCFMTGTGPLSHRIYQFEKAAAPISWRTVVSMGDGLAFYLTERGPYSWDGHSPAIPLDPYEEQNWGDIDLTTETDTWAIRYGDYYILAYKSKGNTTAAATGTALMRPSMLMANRTRLTTAATGDTTTARCMIYDTKQKQWSGVHDFKFLSGAVEEALYADTQDLWVGDATTTGNVGKWDQAGTYQDYSANYEMKVRTGGIGDEFGRTSVDAVRLKLSIQKTETAQAQVQVYSNGSVRDPATWGPVPIDMSMASGLSYGPAHYTNDDTPEDFVIRQALSPYKGQVGKSGYSPQIEFTDSTPDFTAIYAIEADVTTEEE